MVNWAPSAMNLFTSLKDEEIDKILLYVDNSELGSAPAAATAVGFRSYRGEGGKQYFPLSICCIITCVSRYFDYSYQQA